MFTFFSNLVFLPAPYTLCHWAGYTLESSSGQ